MSMPVQPKHFDSGEESRIKGDHDWRQKTKATISYLSQSEHRNIQFVYHASKETSKGHMLQSLQYLRPA
jgi:hypothetical protein